MDFIGKICPYCKAEFKEGDDVVICSACEMPHHKECWIENQGCTTFGCTGTIMGIDNQSSTLYCTMCGKVYTDGEAFCSGCGNALSKPKQQQPYSYYSEQQQSSNYNQGQYTNQTFNTNYGYQNANYSSHNEVKIEGDMRAFVGINQEYFLEKFQKFNGTDSNASWNWASAFLGGFWYAYRKMYKFQFLYYVIDFFIIISIGLVSILMISPLRHTSSTSSTLVTFLPLLIFILPFLLSGMFGNYLYKRHVEKHVRIAGSMEDYAKQNYIIKHGGVSNGAVWVIIGIRVLFFVISVAGRNLK